MPLPGQSFALSLGRGRRGPGCQPPPGGTPPGFSAGPEQECASQLPKPELVSNCFHSGLGRKSWALPRREYPVCSVFSWGEPLPAADSRALGCAEPGREDGVCIAMNA